MSEKDRIKHPVGMLYKNVILVFLKKIKCEILSDTTNGMTFYEIVEIYPTVGGKEYRIMFKVPIIATGIPTDWRTNYYERSGESLKTLKQCKI